MGAQVSPHILKLIYHKAMRKTQGPLNASEYVQSEICEQASKTFDERKILATSNHHKIVSR